MAGTIKRTNPGDAANIFVRCILGDVSDMLGGFHADGQNHPGLQKLVNQFRRKAE